MSMAFIPTNDALIDSLSLKIPFEDCEIIDQRLTSETLVYYADIDEFESELLPPKPIKIIQQGITIRIGLVSIPIYDAEIKKKNNTKFLNITLSSKLLKSKYFEGINSKNIDLLYNAFIDFKIFNCTKSVFLSGLVSDVDICINSYVLSPDLFTDICVVLKNRSGTKERFARLINEPLNRGLSFNTREGAKPSLPFVKFYHKEFELLSKSLNFYEAYIKDSFAISVKHLTRVEATIRNYKHKARLTKFGILPEFKTLGELLEIPKKNLYDFVCFSVASYTEKKVRIKAPKLSPTDHLLFEFIQSLIISGYDLNTLLSMVLTFQGSSEETTAVAQSRMRSKIKSLYDMLTHKDILIKEKELHNKNIADYLKHLNIAF